MTKKNVFSQSIDVCYSFNNFLKEQLYIFIDWVAEILHIKQLTYREFYWTGFPDSLDLVWLSSRIQKDHLPPNHYTGIWWIWLNKLAHVAMEAGPSESFQFYYVKHEIAQEMSASCQRHWIDHRYLGHPEQKLTCFDCF